MKQLLRKAFVDTLPVMTGYLVLGFGFGIILQASGYGIGLALAMSLLIYAGSMQYVAIGLLTGGASLITVALTTLMGASVLCLVLFGAESFLIPTMLIIALLLCLYKEDGSHA